MSDPIKLKITRAGLEAALSADIAGIQIRLDKVKFSTAKFASVVNDSRTTLPNVVTESSIAAGGTSTAQNTLRCFTVVNSTTELSIGSIGLFTDTGVLFAVASVETGELMKILPRISFIMSFGVTLAAEVLDSIKVVIDSAASLAAALIFQHEQKGNPHPQYQAGLNDHQQQIDEIIRFADLLDGRVTQIQQGAAGNVGTTSFQYVSRAFNSANSIYPLFYKANGRTTGAAVNYQLIHVSVEKRPNILEQTIQYEANSLDSWQKIYLPVAVLPGDILSIQCTAYSNVEVNDVNIRVYSIYQERIDGKNMTVIEVMMDRVSGNSPYNGKVKGFMTVKAQGSYPTLESLLAVYPQSQYWVFS